MFLVGIAIITVLVWVQMGYYALLVRTTFFDGLGEAVESQTGYQHFRTFLSIGQSLLLWPGILNAYEQLDDEDEDDDDQQPQY